MGHTLTLPSGWKKARLGECFAERKEINNTDLELLSITGARGIVPRSELEGKDNSNCDKSKYLIVCIGDIAYNTMRMWQGVSALSSYDGIVSPAYTVLVPLKETFAPYFSYLFKLKAMINMFYRNSQGLVDDQRSLKYHNFARIKVTIPPLPEQKRIAEILIEQDKLISLKERLIAAKKKQKKWLMQNLLTGKIRLKGFSGEWVRKKIGDFCEVTAGATPSTQNSRFWDGNIPWMNSGELNQKKIYSVEGRISQLGFESSSTKLLPLRCVLIGLAGQGKTRGTVAINYIRLCTNQSIGAVLPSEKIVPEFLYYNLDSRYNEIRKLSSSDGTRGGLTIPVIETLPIVIAPLSEQTAIAERLTAADQEIELLTKELEAQKQVKKYLMQQLLTGKIRVTGGES